MKTLHSLLLPVVLQVGCVPHYHLEDKLTPSDKETTIVEGGYISSALLGAQGWEQEGTFSLADASFNRYLDPKTGVLIDVGTAYNRIMNINTPPGVDELRLGAYVTHDMLTSWTDKGVLSTTGASPLHLHRYLEPASGAIVDIGEYGRIVSLSIPKK